MRAGGYGRRLPRLNLTGAFGTALMKLASRTQPAGTGSYLRTHLGRHPRFDNSRSQSELGLTYRSPQAALAETLTDLVRWGHLDKA